MFQYNDARMRVPKIVKMVLSPLGSRKADNCKKNKLKCDAKTAFKPLKMK